MSPFRLLRRVTLGLIVAAGAIACLQAEEDPVPFPAEAPGAELAPDSGPPKLIHRVAPVYPAAAKDRTATVGVYVAFIVTPDGAVKNPRALFGRYPDYEPAAVEAVAQWKFSPGRHEGHFVATQMIGLVTFVPAKKS